VSPVALAKYQDNQLDLSVRSASPLELIVILYDGAIHAIQRAGMFLQQGDIAGKSEQIAKASNIVSELAGVLDASHGEVAQNLRGLYGYIALQLLQGNLHNRREQLDVARALLVDLRDAWSELSERQHAQRLQLALSGQGAGHESFAASAV